VQPPAESASPDWVGRTLDERYRIDRVLGAGGLGTVYLATHLRLDRSVAVKMLHRELLPSVELRQRFDREVKTLSRLSHPHIVTLTDSGVLDDGMGYLVMELLEGHSLEERLREQGALEPDEAIEITRQMLLGLAEAHDKGVLHRDLKPANVFIHPLAEGLHVKLLDFGLAKVRGDIATHPGAYPTLTADGVIVGTPTYMAPEQATGGDVTVTADVYAVGIVLFEMLTGRPPFRSENKLETIRAHMLSPVPELDAIAPELAPTDALRAFVHRALAKERTKRFADARTMLRELDALPRPAATLREGKRVKASRAHAPSSVGTEDTIALRSGELEVADDSRALAPPALPIPIRVGPPIQAAPATTPRRWRRLMLMALAGVSVIAALALAWLGPAPIETAPTLPPPTGTSPTIDPQPDDESDVPSTFSWGDVPDELRAARRDLLRGHGLSPTQTDAVETYARLHPNDARAPLLLARSARFRSLWPRVVTLYSQAYDADASTVGFPPMLSDLVHASGDPSASEAASDAVVRMFGASAGAAVDQRIAEVPEGAEHDLLQRLRARLDAE
jgi:serine/threonine protein kinase